MKKDEWLKFENAMEYGFHASHMHLHKPHFQNTGGQNYGMRNV